ncbi:MAG: AAA family ATPase [Pseudonocardia sediminis]
MRGRVDERSTIDTLLSEAGHGRAGVLEIVGDPGIGKTALCDHAAATPGFRVLRALGVQGEADLPLAGLDELLRPLAADAGDLPPAQRAAVRTLLDGGGGAADRYALGVATLGLLARAAEDRPLLVVLDDVHWLDDVSGAVLSFALRRLGADAVAVLLAGRTSPRRPLDGPWPRLHVGGLDTEDAHALLGSATAPAVRDVLHTVTGGNPLALLELAQALTAEQLAGWAELPDPLPLSDRGTAAFGWRLTELPDRTRRALVVVAAAGPGSAGLIDPALRARGLAVSDLEPAERAGLLEIRSGQPRFPHPLVRAATFADASGPQRRAAHRALADAGVGGDVQRHALHLAAGTVGASEDVAAALERAAEAAEHRGGPAAGAAARTWAARLSPDGPEIDGRRLAAAEACLLAGRRADAGALVEELITAGRERETRWRALALQASIALWSGEHRDPAPAMRGALEALAGPAPDLAALVSVQLGTVLTGLGLLSRSSEVTARARLLDITDPVIRYLVEHRHAATAVWAGDTGAFADADRTFPYTRLAGAARERFPMHDVLLPQTLMLVERFAEAGSLIEADVAGARAGAAPHRLPLPLLHRAGLGYFTGDLLRVRADLDEVDDINRQVGPGGLSGYTWSLQARAASVAGDRAATVRHATEALAVGEQIGQQPVVLHARHALGLLELTHGRPADAVGHLDRCRDIALANGLGNPLAAPWQADHVEALHLAGRESEALAALDELDATAARTGSRWARGAAARCRALAGGVARDRDALYEAAARDQHDLPLERGRTLLAQGTALRRERRVREAREILTDAAGQLDRAGAPAWAARARSELRAAGVRSVTAPSTHPALTGQELRVCLAVADGATNREVAASLFVSPKTVEHHLGRAFGKLGVTNRAQLARLVAERGLGTPADAEDSA